MVGVVIVGVVIVCVGIGCLIEVDDRGCVERRDSGRGNRVFDGGLERVDEEHEICLAHVAHRRGGELNVMRLHAGRGEGGDADKVAANMLGDVLERIERCRHRQCRAVVVVPL